MLYVQNQEIVICCCIHLTTRSIDEGTWLRFCAELACGQNDLVINTCQPIKICGTNIESYEFLMELANIRFLIQLLAIGY